MTRALLSSATALSLVALAVACQSRPSPTEPAASLSRAPGADTVPIKDLKPEIRSMKVPGPGVLTTWVPGEALGDESSRAVLSAPVSGTVATAPAAPGRPVPAGKELLTLRSPELADLKSRWLAARARLGRATSEVAREQRLGEAGAGAIRDLEHAQAEHGVALAEAESSRMALQARGLDPEQAEGVFRLKAPAPGTVVDWKVRLGQGVQANEVLGSFLMGSAALVQVDLPPPAPEGWKLGARTRVRTEGGSWKAEVVGLPAIMGETTHRLAYRLRLQGPPLPLPGTPMEVEVPLGQGVLVPTGALQQVDGGWGVFLEEGDTARFIPVKRGPESQNGTLILGGAPAQGSIVVEGAYLLKSKLLRLRSGGSND
ncbi:MAG: efflux RND transporter periplasmic adaptor subunit [Acidobacteria bacterium]|nr:efflux RND transporter periplasmic adaptor subunit [Acidobacteriota bacterium]